MSHRHGGVFGRAHHRVLVRDESARARGAQHRDGVDDRVRQLSGVVVATFSFLAADAPRYRTGYSICMGATCVGVLASVGYAGLVVREDRKLRSAGGGEMGLRRFAL